VPGKCATGCDDSLDGELGNLCDVGGGRLIACNRSRADGVGLEMRYGGMG
jgi:hypothetical protein